MFWKLDVQGKGRIATGGALVEYAKDEGKEGRDTKDSGSKRNVNFSKSCEECRGARGKRSYQQDKKKILEQTRPLFP